MSNLPPIGSLWLHRESGERRFVVRVNAYVRWVETWSDDEGHSDWAEFDTEAKSWLSWAAHADRIDKEEA